MEGLVSPAGQGGVARHLGVRDMPLEVVQLLDERPHTVPIDVCMVRRSHCIGMPGRGG